METCSSDTIIGTSGGKMICDGISCTGCGLVILDRYILEVSGLPYHSKCLKCADCQILLENESLCYLRNSQVYCKTDYQILFGTKCSKCSRFISPTDWVRRAKSQVFHLACFSCEGCKRQLSTGEEFALLDEKVLCKSHFQEIFEVDRSSNEGDSCDGESSSSSNKSKTKRVRTTFTDDQLGILQANFQQDSNPDGQDLERIAQITGLSKRVTQVWFQNSRARQKKHMAKQKKGVFSLHPHQGNSSFEKSSIVGQLSDSDNSTSGASPLTMLYSFT